MTPLATAWTIARRDLRGSLAGLRLLLICLFLGVATLAAIGSLSSAIGEELAARGQAILGGDIEIGIAQREATDEELAKLGALGTLSSSVRMQAMARLPDGSDTQLAELKGVDNAYPLYGTFTLANGKTAPELAADQIVVAPALAERLGIKVGDKLAFGSQTFRVIGLIGDEPDRLSEGLSLGPVAITSLAGIRATRLIQPGSMFEAKYRLLLPPTRDPKPLAKSLQQQNQAAAWETRTRDDGAPSTRRFLDRMGQFLTLVGLAALIIAGIGVGNGVAAYLTAKRNAIATLKILGATSAVIFRVYLLQILAVALIAIVAGLVFGAVAPAAIVALAGDVLPIKPDFAIHPLPLAVSALYGLLIALIFALPPLARARFIPAAGLFRGQRAGWRALGAPVIAAIIGGAAIILALAIFGSSEPIFSAGFLGVALGIFALLTLLGVAIRGIASRLPRPKAPLLRLALANLHRPGAQTGQLVVALGLGLTLFATLAAIQTSLNNEVRMTVPAEAPDYFILDVPSARSAEFRQAVAKDAPGAAVNVVPTLRGTITEFAGQRVADLKQLPEGAWVLRGDRGLTYSATLPEGSTLVAGKWWPAGYAGPPLVSVDAEQAGALGLKVGDSLSVSLLGVEIKAKVASLRQVNWRNFGFNYVLVFPPNVFADVPHNVAATVQLAKGQDDAPLMRALPRAFPAISMVKVKEIAGQIGDILTQMATAIAAAASIAILAGIAVLIGAIVAGRQARVYDSVILKLLGATRGQVLAAQAIEYAALALLLTAIALALGTGGAWYVITQIFDFTWQPDWGVVLATMAVGAVGTLGIGLIGSLPVLSARPARALRDL